MDQAGEHLTLTHRLPPNCLTQWRSSSTELRHRESFNKWGDLNPRGNKYEQNPFPRWRQHSEPLLHPNHMCNTTMPERRVRPLSTSTSTRSWVVSIDGRDPQTHCHRPNPQCSQTASRISRNSPIRPPQELQLGWLCPRKHWVKQKQIGQRPSAVFVGPASPKSMCVASSLDGRSRLQEMWFISTE